MNEQINKQIYKIKTNLLVRHGKEISHALVVNLHVRALYPELHVGVLVLCDPLEQLVADPRCETCGWWVNRWLGEETETK
jgi:hypothetical protein